MSIAPHSNFSSICTRFRDISVFMLQHTTFSHPTSSLPKFPPVPLKQVDGLWTTKSEGIWLSVRAIIQFPRFPTYVILNDPPTLQTDRQATCDRNTALCTKVHRAVKTVKVTQSSVPITRSTTQLTQVGYTLHYSVNKSLQQSLGRLQFSYGICLSSSTSCVCDLSCSSSFSLLCCSRLDMRSLYVSCFLSFLQRVSIALC